jgi:diketogulonate reductase-like aldo/keto reductase
VRLRHGANFSIRRRCGNAERVLGHALLHDRRDEVLIATKVWASSVTEASEQGGQRPDVTSMGESTLPDTQPGELETAPRNAEQLQTEGKVRTIGATHYSQSAFDELRTVMGTGRIAAIQIPQPDRVRSRADDSAAGERSRLGRRHASLRRGLAAEAPAVRSRSEPLRPFGVATWSQALLKWSLSDRRCHVAIPATTSERTHAVEREGRVIRPGSVLTSAPTSRDWHEMPVSRQELQKNTEEHRQKDTFLLCSSVFFCG